MVKRINSLLLLAFSFIGGIAQNDSIPIKGEVKNLYNPFDSISYDKVIAYNFNYDVKTGYKKHTHSEFGPDLEQFNYYSLLNAMDGIIALDTLSKKEIDSAITILSDTSTYGKSPYACFEPRLGLSFFKGNKAELDILLCFDCNTLESSIPIPASKKYFIDFKRYEIIPNTYDEDTTKPYFGRKYLDGFSEEGHARLVKFCQSLNLVYCYTE